MYNIKLIVNFPKEGRIEEFEMYGKKRFKFNYRL
uniref:Uncharacterized protein n=1 Tax=uncultured marine thaumarchaeote SAT1000_10_G06 TaxID=1456374 RepID=A0A075I4J4_9ARCH|nr:hypothetical protein [uncultured marine thaumarchaeote SAT1000_10_G06]